MKNKKVDIKNIIKKLKGGENENTEFKKDMEEIQDLISQYETDIDSAIFYMEQLETFEQDFKWLLDWTTWFLKQ